ncbi:hypothetical protein CNEO4_420037 [Clostridium neonatale]|nr:hypothetical protein CNEO4_420037 [Clostridium neonatale]CAI3663296.1 hypothetical protein CNEO3_440028 [Clostridium neonatale]CAI4140621.1 hypothetical protein CNEO4_440039 [Clostridium neonatale]
MIMIATILLPFIISHVIMELFLQIYNLYGRKNSLVLCGKLKIVMFYELLSIT